MYVQDITLSGGCYGCITPQCEKSGRRNSRDHTHHNYTIYREISTKMAILIILEKKFSRMIHMGNINSVAWQHFHKILILRLSKICEICENKVTRKFLGLWYLLLWLLSRVHMVQREYLTTLCGQCQLCVDIPHTQISTSLTTLETKHGNRNLREQQHWVMARLLSLKKLNILCGHVLIITM